MRSIIVLVTLIPFYFLGQYRPTNGVTDSKAGFIALKNAEVVVSPDKTIKNATILIQGESIVDVGILVNIPAGTKEIDCSDLVILPGFIELNSDLGLPKPSSNGGYNFRPQLESNKKGAYYWNESVHPEVNASDSYEIDTKKVEELINFGITYTLSHHQDGIFRGTGSLVSLGVEDVNRQMIKPKAAQVISFQKGSSKQTYPSSQMGSIALIRQFLYDAKWYSDGNSKETDLSIEAYLAQNSLPILFETKDKWEILRAEKIAEEFGLYFNYFGSGNEYMAHDQFSQVNGFVILPLNFPEAYEVRDPYVARQIPLSDLKHWEMAPSNPHVMKTEGVDFCFTSSGLKTSDQFWKNLNMTMQRGLSKKDVLAALTVNPAKLLGVEKKLGTLEKGKLASFSIYSADPFAGGKLLEVWTIGEQKVLSRAPEQDILGKYTINVDGKRYPLEIAGSKEKPDSKVSVIKDVKDEKTGLTKKDTVQLKAFTQLIGNDLTLQFNVDDENFKGSISLHGKVNMRVGVLFGDASLPDGRWVQWSAVKSDKVKENKQEPKNPEIDTMICQRIWYPHMAYGFDTKPSSETIVIRNAQLWTNEEQGVIKEGTIIVQDRKITFVGQGGFTIPTGARVIDAKGKHVTPGIIDEHSHIAISKGVNEGGQSISAEVSIGDVVNPDDINIYRQLSGGVTAAQLLHGSANPVGGQSALIKLKWGATPEEMLIDNAPKFIKFALGENVKQANWGDFNTVRFPQTRMGVEQVYYDGFHRAQEYMAAWEQFKSDEKGKVKEPRKDLELEVLAEILRSERFISCHSYVQSEINMLMKVADSMGFKVNTFTHILEGYKVADKMLAHGVGASTFSDWWAYKYEVNDAIPYNASLMNEIGLVVAINSDDAEMGRRLNQEAAKGIKYGGMTEVEALKMVTLNPAKLLHLDDRMGSLKVGKDADLVIWSDNPLSIQAKAEMTIIDGTVMFDAEKDKELQVVNRQEKARIINKMLESNDKGEPSKPFLKKKAKHFHCDTMGEEGSEGENQH